MDLQGKTVIIVDDGVATGATMRAAVRSARDRGPARVVAAVPVASRASAHDVRHEVDDFIAVVTPARFDTVSSAYDDYSPVSDDDVLSMLGRPHRHGSPMVRDISERMGTALTRAEGRMDVHERTLAIRALDAKLVADLGLPRHAPAKRGLRPSGVRGLVLVAHSGGSSRNSYRNRYLAGRLRLSGYATLRIDLLTSDERVMDDEKPSYRFDIDRLATRLASACDWAESEGVPGAHRTVLLGAATSSAAALVAAARRPGRVFAVASRGGRPDLAVDALPNVKNPVLLIVGGADDQTLRHNTSAIDRLPRGAVLVRVPRSGHGFEEPGALGLVGEHLVSWLDRLEARQRTGLRWHA
jgi:putative phosphoribosyl transferase